MNIVDVIVVAGFDDGLGGEDLAVDDIAVDGDRVGGQCGKGDMSGDDVGGECRALAGKVVALCL